MKSKQSSRIYYYGKDHKDVFFEGKYYPVMAAKNEYGCEGVIWRKLFPDKYYMTRSSQWWLNGYQTVRSLGIYYNELDNYREEYRFLEDESTVKGAKFLAFAETAYKSPYGYTVSNQYIHLSTDGKYFKKFDLDHVICAGPFFVSNGFVYVFDDGTNYAGGTSYFYHVRVDKNMKRIGNEELICEIADGTNDFHKSNLIRCPHVGTDPDVILYSYDSLYAITMDGGCHKVDFSVQYKNTNYMSYQNGRFILPAYEYSKATGYVTYLAESSDGRNWTKHSFNHNINSGQLVVLWNGSEYICYANEYYDSSNSCINVYAGGSLGGLSLVNSLQGDGYAVQNIAGNKSVKGNLTLVFDTKYTESYFVKYDGIYRISISDLQTILTETLCFKNYQQIPPQEILIGSSYLGKYGGYSTYWTVYIDNLYLKTSDRNFLCYNHSPGSNDLKEWGTDMAEYHARR